MEDKCCGNCCWFYGEDTDGWGMCACLKNQEMLDSEHRSDMCEENFVSRQEMRHHMAVLLQTVRRHMSFYGNGDRVTDAIEFAYRYMKIFSNL